MADRIKISTSDLENQATRLTTLGNQMEDISEKADKALSLIRDALGSKFSSNMDRKSKSLIKLNSLKDSFYTGAEVANKCASTYQNADKVLRDMIGDSLPQEIKDSPASSQSVYIYVDKSVYNQNAYDYKFKEWYDYNKDGKLDHINTGCVITSCAYALSLMGITTTPLEAYERSGGCRADFNKISQGKAYISGEEPVSKLNEMAKKTKVDNNISPIMLRVKNNTHTCVLEDVEIDANGNITKYIVFDPWEAKTVEYTNLSQIGINYFTYYTRA